MTTANRQFALGNIQLSICEPGMKPAQKTSDNDWAFYLLAAVCGVLTGWADVAIDDLLFTALLVLSACILLGILRPRAPWRWMVAVVIFVPLTELIAYQAFDVKPGRAQVYASFLTALPGIVGAYGGAVVRRVAENLKQGK